MKNLLLALTLITSLFAEAYIGREGGGERLPQGYYPIPQESFHYLCELSIEDFEKQTKSLLEFHLNNETPGIKTSQQGWKHFTKQSVSGHLRTVSKANTDDLEGHIARLSFSTPDESASEIQMRLHLSLQGNDIIGKDLALNVNTRAKFPAKQLNISGQFEKHMKAAGGGFEKLTGEVSCQLIP
jgi:hypothetical protein